MRLFLFFSYCLIPIFANAQIINDSCHQAIELFCGDVLWVNLDGANRATSEYFDDCGPDEVGVWYKIVGNGDYILVSSCYEYSLNITVYEGNCDSLNCVQPIIQFPTYQCDIEDQTEAAFLSEAGKTYYIYCRSNTVLTFGRLQISCYAPLSNDVCTRAKLIILDSTYTYDHRFGTPSYHPTCLNSYYQNFADGWYSFTGNGGYVQLDKFSGYNLRSCLIKEDCSGTDFVNKELVSGDFAYLTKEGVTYYLQLVSPDPEPQSFRLRSFEKAGNDICSNAEPFLLQDTLTLSFKSTIASIKACTNDEGTYDRWYYFTGNDSIFTFTWNPYSSFTGTNVKILTGTCDSLVCETTTRARNQISVPTVAGKRYLVNIHNSFSYEHDTPVKVTATITAPLTNDEYTGATPLQPGDTLSGTLAYALEDQEINNLLEVRSVWYRVKGTGAFYSVTTKAYLQSFEKIFYTEKNGTLLVAPHIDHTYSYLKKDSIYYLNITGNYDSWVNDFEIFLNVHPVDEHDVCSGAIPVSVADTISGRMWVTLEETFDSCSSYGTRPDVWYQFNGDGQLKDLVFENINSDLVFGLFRGSCGSLECITHWFNPLDEPTTSKRVFLEQDVSYFLKVQDRKNSFRNRIFRFYFEDLGPAANALCHNAQLVSCGDTVRATLDHVAPCDYADPCLQKEERRIWYEMIGQGELVNLSLSAPGYEHIFGIEIYEGNCCSLPKVDPIIDEEGRLNFLAEKDKKYLIAVSTSATGYGTRFDLHLSCTPPNQFAGQWDEKATMDLQREGNRSPDSCPLESLPCPNTIQLKDAHLYSQVFDAGKILVSSAELGPETKVLYRAGERIVLRPGFQVKANSEFRASIQNCSDNAPTIVSEHSTLDKKEDPAPQNLFSKNLEVEVFPNPFSQTTTIHFFIPTPGHAGLYVYDFRGIRLLRLYNGPIEEGWHTTTLDGGLLPVGKYLLNLRTSLGVINRPISVF
ncbi:T9SS type A sorting domain-containing protein [Flavilitoribacter nigricans]|uniref:T9SS-like galactose binding domain-containing protein n=1 Tax=Flavilitoribacter nigricans (strain ATCC 23147 / DSM 23189 / NBRC 102662 / NCIMB 1420 / SS-2) TaxID=1122177 RepID=A0A2D0N364_FLAN2|nr:T9SS type A sorting domain-containing protein [Flavilitoribacter nigricans]PHN02838.1 hypothetical protein CRP01_30115 [Flavilitoribacter nigricans DSM 23189 = NBRC 102662]